MTKFYEYSIERIKNGNCVVLINNLFNCPKFFTLNI